MRANSVMPLSWSAASNRLTVSSGPWALAIVVSPATVIAGAPLWNETMPIITPPARDRFAAAALADRRRLPGVRAGAILQKNRQGGRRCDGEARPPFVPAGRR